MQIEFKKEQIIKKQNSIMIDYGEYKLSIPNWMIKNNRRLFRNLCIFVLQSTSI
ncbi:hypothetical protein [Spiroplasma endosymbiont of Dactylopius coccus]